MKPSRSVLPDHLIVFARFPKPEAAETRLGSTVDNTRAGAVSRTLTEETLRRLRVLRDLQLCSLEVRVAGASPLDFRDPFGGEHAFIPQGDGNLGYRMSRAVGDGFAAGAQRIVIVGSDDPELGAEHVSAAFAGLETRDVVIGPATDGGCYLLALNRPTPGLFKTIEWGAPRLLPRILERVAQLGLTVGWLETLSDFDRPHDRADGECRSRRATAQKPRISVIIPALDEQATIAAAVASSCRNHVEVIVVDGGSSDRTREIAAQSGARVIRASRGRARQMNAGAAAAHGAILLFLHADTTLPDGFDDAVMRGLEDSGAGLCAFKLALEAKGWRFRLIETLVDLRSRFFRMPYGDQAFSIRADRFREVGGFPVLPIMEDYALVRCLRRRGRVTMLATAVQTSARRWRMRGVWRTTLINQVCIAAYRIGVSPERILRLRAATVSPAPRVGGAQRPNKMTDVRPSETREAHLEDANVGVAREPVWNAPYPQWSGQEPVQANSTARGSS